MQTKKKLLVFLVAIILVGLVFNVAPNMAVAQEVTQQEETETVWDVIQNDEQLTDFALWLKAAGLDDNLKNDGLFTIFAPTNAAMATFESDAAALEATRTEILLYHLVNGSYNGPSVANRSTLPTLLGEEIAITVQNGQIKLNDVVSVTMTDLEAENGVVHIIDTVLAPPVNSLVTASKGSKENTLDQVLADDGRFTTLLSLFEKAGMMSELRNTSHGYTLFAPTDAAFEKLSEDQVNDWLTDPEVIQTLVSYHFVNDMLSINQIATDDLIPTAKGRPLFVTTDDSVAVFLNGRQIEEFNIVAANGVMHVVDTVLMP